MKPSIMPPWDHTSHEEFYEYYADQSQSTRSLRRFYSIRDAILRVLSGRDGKGRQYEVADVACGAGSQCRVWAELGHIVHGLDLNEPLVRLGTERARAHGFAIDFCIGSATNLPWMDESMDICLVIELIEHVVDWRACLLEAKRVLRPRGVLFLTTSNVLCPIQYEFNLPAYSWYPRRVKRYVEHLAVTTKPGLASHARYPAVNWFTPYSLRTALKELGFRSMDRFDLIDLTGRGTLTRWIVTAVRVLPLLRWLGHVATRGTILLATRDAAS